VELQFPPILEWEEAVAWVEVAEINKRILRIVPNYSNKMFS
jgi:hypothetical protein